MIEKVEFTNMCMVYDGDKVLVIDRQKKDWRA
jgi:8-oxo-dGTP diphosphatase